MAGTMALVIVLSVFNGFESMVTRLFNTFNPDIKIVAAQGKTFSADSLPMQQLRDISGIDCYTGIVEENALLQYMDKQYIVTLKGVDPNFSCTSEVANAMVEGRFVLEQGSADYAVLGQGIAYNMGIPLDDPENPLTVYVPRRTASRALNPLDAFNSLDIRPAGIFGIQQDFDSKYVLVPLRFAQSLLDYPKRLSAVELRIAETADADEVLENIRESLGPAFVVKNRYEQEEVLFKIMKSEKLAVFAILGFILIIATFNVIGSLSMLILDKKKDIAVLNCLGAGNGLIRRIFITEGLLISLSGAVLGLLAGFVVVLLQQQFGLIGIGGSETFAAQAYPVAIQWLDFVYVLLIDLIIGLLAVWFPVSYVSQKYFKVQAAA